MDEKQAKAFGTRLKQLRADAGLSLRQLRDVTGIDDSLISRMESGHIMSPGPDKLASLARAFGLPMADLFAAADYVVPADLPSPGPYLRAKFQDLSAQDMKRLESEVGELLARYGVDPSGGPAPGEDETPTTPSKTSTNKNTRGGTTI